MDLATGKKLLFDGSELFTSTGLGDTMVNSSLTSVGALDAGSITSGFGSIDTGSSNISTTGTTTSGTVNVISNTASESSSTGALTAAGGAGIEGDTHIGGTLTVSGQSILGGGVAFQDTNLEITTNSFDADASSLVFRKSRNPTDGDHAVAQENDTVGSMLFVASDGNSFEKAADIRGVIDGTPGETVMPGRLEFLTTEDGGFIPTEKMRIAQDGLVSIHKSLSVGETADIVGAIYNE